MVALGDDAELPSLSAGISQHLQWHWLSSSGMAISPWPSSYSATGGGVYLKPLLGQIFMESWAGSNTQREDCSNGVWSIHWIPLRRIRSAGPRTQPWSGLTPSRPPETQLQAHSIPSHGISSTTSFAQGKHGSKELRALRIHPISHCSPSSQSATRLQEL